MSARLHIGSLPRGCRGFSFVEIVVAFGLLSVMVAIFFNLIPSSTLASLRAENRLSASNIGQNTLETLRASPYDALDSHNDVTREEKRGSTTFTVTTNVNDVSGINPNFMKHAKVRVTWIERKKEQNLSYELRILNQNR